MVTLSPLYDHPLVEGSLLANEQTLLVEKPFLIDTERMLFTYSVRGGGVQVDLCKGERVWKVDHRTPLGGIRKGSCIRGFRFCLIPMFDVAFKQGSIA